MSIRPVPYTLLVAGALFLAACSDPGPPPPAADAPPAPVADAPGATTDASPEPAAVIGFEGFGPARFGQEEEALRMAWGGPLNPAVGSSDTCHYLFPETGAIEGYGIAFMIENGRFVRFDIDGPTHASPGGGMVGSSEAEIREAHAGRVEEMPHKYVEGGHYLIVTAPEGGQTRLVFETDADGRVTQWRIGLLPQVLYVEGCS